MMHNNSHNPGGRHHALPMFGIGQADVIYETLAEGNITRMMALYHDLSALPKIGAVRSTRPYFVELALAYDAVLIHAGGSPQAIRDISNWGVNTVNSMTQPATNFWRDNSDRPGVSSEHTMFTSGERLAELFEKLSRQTVEEGFNNGLGFNNHPTVSGGAAANSIRVPFNNKPTWFYYNAEDGLYYMEQYGAAFIDGADGAQVTVTNVIIKQTSISVIPGDPEGRRQIDLQSGGHGYYAANGLVIPIIWSRGAHNAPFRYTDASGGSLEFLPGRTYIGIIPNSQTPEFE
jgi:hypothetical protein